MKSRNLLGLCSLLALFSACGNGAPKYDATGTFETTEVLVSAEASGRLLYFDIEEGMLLKAGEEVGVVDTVQLYLKKLQLEASLKSVEEQRPDILKQVAATKEQISAAQRERNRVANLLKVGAANQKQLDDAEDQLEVLRKQLVAQNSTLSNSHQSLTWQSSSVGIQVAQVEDQLKKCHITSPITGTVLSQVKLGQKVTVFSDYGTDEHKQYPGVVTWISDTSEFTPKTILTKNERANLVYAVKIAVHNDGLLKIGMYGGVEFSD